ncbi:MAG: MCE family protein [Bacteroidetes bacterium]|nr:MCE family protein [Bacteroidota bacterium]
MNFSNEVKTALLFIFGIALFLIGFSYLKSNDVFVSDRVFYGVYDNTEGLVNGTPVTINGYTVGAVESSELLQPTGKILVTFRVENDFPFSKNSIAQIYESGLIGGKALAVVPAFDNAALAAHRDTLQTSVAPGLTDLVNEKLSPLQEKIESMIVHADSVLIAFSNVLDTQRQEALRQSIDHFNETTAALATLTTSLDKNLNSSDGTLNKTFASLERVSANAVAITDSLQQAPLGATIRSLKQTSDDLALITSKMSAGEGSLGKLIHSDSLINALNQTSNQAQLLLEDLRLNPKRYVHFSLFGKKNKTYQEPKTSK